MCDEHEVQWNMFTHHTHEMKFIHSYKTPFVMFFALFVDAFLGGLIEHLYLRSITSNQIMPNTKT